MTRETSAKATSAPTQAPKSGGSDSSSRSSSRSSLRSAVQLAGGFDEQTKLLEPQPMPGEQSQPIVQREAKGDAEVKASPTHGSESEQESEGSTESSASRVRKSPERPDEEDLGWCQQGSSEMTSDSAGAGTTTTHERTSWMSGEDPAQFSIYRKGKDSVLRSVSQLDTAKAAQKRLAERGDAEESEAAMTALEIAEVDANIQTGEADVGELEALLVTSEKLEAKRTKLAELKSQRERLVKQKAAQEKNAKAFKEASDELEGKLSDKRYVANEQQIEADLASLAVSVENADGNVTTVDSTTLGLEVPLDAGIIASVKSTKEVGLRDGGIGVSSSKTELGDDFLTSVPTTTENKIEGNLNVVDTKAEGSKTTSTTEKLSDGSSSKTVDSLEGGVSAKDGKISGNLDKSLTKSTTDASGKEISSSSTSVGVQGGYDTENEVGTFGFNTKSNSSNKSSKSTPEKGVSDDNDIHGKVDVTRGTGQTGINVGRGFGYGDTTTDAKGGSRSVSTKFKGNGGASAKVDVEPVGEGFQVTITSSINGGLELGRDGDRSWDAGSKGSSDAGSKLSGSGALEVSGSSQVIVVRTISREEADAYLGKVVSSDPSVATGDEEIDNLRKAILNQESADSFSRGVSSDSSRASEMKPGERVSTTTEHRFGGKVDGSASSGAYGVGVTGGRGGGCVSTVTIERLETTVRVTVKIIDKSDTSLGGNMSAHGVGGSVSSKEDTRKGASSIFEVPCELGGVIEEIADCDDLEDLAAATKKHNEYCTKEGRHEGKTDEQSHSVSAFGVEVGASDKRRVDEDVVLNYKDKSVAGSKVEGEHTTSSHIKVGELVELGESSSNISKSEVTSEGLKSDLAMSDSSSKSLFGGLTKSGEEVLVTTKLSEQDMKTLVSRAGEVDRWTRCCHDLRLLDAWHALRVGLRRPKVDAIEGAVDPKGAKWLGRARALAKFVSEAPVDDGRVVFRNAIHNWDGVEEDLGVDTEWPIMLAWLKGRYETVLKEGPEFAKEIQGKAKDMEALTDDVRGTSSIDPALSKRHRALLKDLEEIRDALVESDHFASARAKGDMTSELTRVGRLLRDAWTRLWGASTGANEDLIGTMEIEDDSKEWDERLDVLRGIFMEIKECCDAAEAEGDDFHIIQNRHTAMYEHLKPVGSGLDRMKAESQRLAELHSRLGRSPSDLTTIEDSFGYAAAQKLYDKVMADASGNWGERPTQHGVVSAVLNQVSSTK